MGLADDLAALPQEERDEVLAGLSPEQLETLLFDWPVWARPEQLAPKEAQGGGPWDTWMFCGGRGTGKTRSGAEWTRTMMCGPTPLSAGECQFFAIIGETTKDVRDVLVEGPAGILSVHPAPFRPKWQPSKNRLTWPNGAVATVYNGTEPGQLRGPQFGGAWVDELAKYRYAEETWDMLQFGLRLGAHPRAMVTTTPRPLPLIKKLLADQRTAVTKGHTYDNSENLAESFIAAMRARYEGTRLGRQELSAEVIDDDPNALWRRSVIDEMRVKSGEKIPDMIKMVVSVDPAAKGTDTKDAESTAQTGIIVAGLGADGLGYVFDDLTCDGDPNTWARRAVSAWDRYTADRIIAEENNGGEMVRMCIQSVRPLVPVKLVRASRGKVSRAEPVAALYEQRKIRHVGNLGPLEDEMVAFNNINPVPGQTKDRVDALVWAFTELFPQLVKQQRPKWTDRWSNRGRGSYAS